VLQPHEGSSETGEIVLNGPKALKLQPHEGSSETVRVRHPATRLAGFNPTRVRLKRIAWVLIRSDDRAGLQPHEGSSETSTRRTISTTKCRFNPTRVRLKHSPFAESPRTIIPLQPHEGSSETAWICPAVVQRGLLQPHEGSSETVIHTGKDAHPELLQPHEGSSETGWRLLDDRSEHRFNPTRVRLKPVSNLIPELNRQLQPHEGSSETRRRWPSSSPCCPLQPHEGSSETNPATHHAKGEICFNPTRVRLKPAGSSWLP